MFASSPEDLETLLEDAVLLGDEAAVADLFDPDAVLISGPLTIRPSRALAELTRLGYVASIRSVVVRRDSAVVISEDAVNLSLRSADGSWRLVATIMRPRTPQRGQDERVP